MDNSIAKIFMNPAVLIGGVVLGLLVLIMTRGSAASSGSDNSMMATLQSQATSAQTNVALGAQQTDYNKAALSYQATIAGIAAQSHASDVQATTALSLQTMQTLENITTNAQNTTAAIVVNHDNNAAMIKGQQIQAQTAITLAPIQSSLQQSLAQISAQEAVALATIGGNTQTAIANTNAATAQNIASGNQDTSTTNTILNGAIKLLGGWLGSNNGTTSTSSSSSSGNDTNWLATAATVAAFFI